MWFSSWLAKRQRCSPSGRRRTSSRKRPICRPRLEALEDRWLPSQVSLTVSSLADSGSGTLRDAINTADAGKACDKFTISFSVTGTIDLQSPLPHLNNSITIQGPGTSSITVERAAGVSFPMRVPMIVVDTGQTATIAGLTIANADNGAIDNVSGATLTISNCVVANNASTPGGFGGGVNNNGSLTISGCTFSGNSAEEGGGIFNSGTLTVTGSTLSGNSSVAGEGGGIFNEGTLTVSGCTLSGNSAAFGGGIYNMSATEITSSNLSGNSAADGGGLYNAGGAGLSVTVTISGSTVSGNSATFDGGGILNGEATLTVRDSQLTGNHASARGGAIITGGVPSEPATATITGCTLSGNSASLGGAILNVASYNDPLDSTLIVRGSTLFDNTASDSGGAIYNSGATTVQQSTLSGNSATNDGGGIFNAASGTLTVKDSTVTNNTAPSGADIYNLGALTLDDSTVGVIGP
jgi:hypothetical protein